MLERTIAGIEGALLWGPSAGKGRRGRTPDAVRAVRRGGPGAPVTVAWHHLLRLSGEHVTPEMLADPAKRDTLNRRFNRRIDALEAAGYKVGKDGPAAPAGDTIEIVKVVKGGRHHEACIVVRATARFCAAYAPGARAHQVAGKPPAVAVTTVTLTPDYRHTDPLTTVRQSPRLPSDRAPDYRPTENRRRWRKMAIAPRERHLIDVLGRSRRRPYDPMYL